ncbi:MAG: hypothetical protein KF901_17610 [Myxococcales bacterium]|nr:hypothetical protein [Myxococcales bacterium]
MRSRPYLALSLLLAACTSDTPEPRPADTGTADAGPPDTGTADTGAVDAAVCTRIETLEPAAAGSVAELPEQEGMRSVSVIGVASTYFKTTDDDRELRRGIVEIVVPADAADALGATLRFRTSVDSVQPAPPNEAHAVLAYREADGALTIEDFDREAEEIGVVSPDADDYAIALLARVRASAGAPLGFRFQLAPPHDTATEVGARAAVFLEVRLDLELPCE